MNCGLIKLKEEMANYIITRNKQAFEKVGKYLYCDLEDMILPDTIACDTETSGI